MNIYITGALFTSSLSIRILNSQCKKRARDVHLSNTSINLNMYLDPQHIFQESLHAKIFMKLRKLHIIWFILQG